MKKSKLECKEKWIEAIKKSDPSDFDGHTEFSKLDAKQKLQWLSECARFISIVNGQKSGYSSAGPASRGSSETE